MLDIHQQIYLGMGETLSHFDMERIVKDFETPNLYSQTKCDVTKRISDAFNHFFRRVRNKETPGFPKFKKRVFYKSITFPQYLQEIYPNNRLYVSKVGLIRIIRHRDIQGTIKTLTIKKEGDEWYATFSCENVPIEKQENKFKSEFEGLDVGINKFVVCSDGRTFDNPKFLKRSEKKLARLQRRLSRKKKGSANRRKARIKVGKLQINITRQREDFHKKLARQLASEIKYIGIEDLNIQGMVKNHCLARSISDAGWGSFFLYLKYYKTIFDGGIIRIGRFEPTSQTCSSCGHKQDMPLKEREFVCEECGLTIDRDLGASLNIKKETKNILNNTEGYSEFQACGLCVRPSPMKAAEVEAGNFIGRI